MNNSNLGNKKEEKSVNADTLKVDSRITLSRMGSNHRNNRMLNVAPGLNRRSRIFNR